MTHQIDYALPSIPSQYQEKVLQVYHVHASRAVLNEHDQQMVLGAIGLSGEAGEVADLIKKAIFQQKPFDREQLISELGDVFWYFTLLCDAAGLSLAEIIEENTQKMQQRFPSLDIDR